MELSVHVWMERDDTDAATLEAVASLGVHIRWGRSVPSPARYDILVAGRPTREAVEASARLRALVIPFAGVPAATRELMLQFPQIAVHNLHHNAAPTAELTVALLLAAAKRVVPFDRALRAGDWRPRYRPSEVMCLEDRTCVILGHGAVGARVGEVCRAMGMHVHGFGSDAGEAWRAALASADVLIATLPLTPRTEGLIGAAELAALPPNAIVVNTGRAATIDEEALYDALASGRLGAAGLDVWYRYPRDEDARADTAPSRFPFGALDNVVLSPHRGGQATDTEYRRMRAVARLLEAAARGAPLPDRVDLSRGY